MNKNSSLYENYINDLKIYSKQPNETRLVANQLLRMHSEICKRESPVVLELGVDRGQSTKVFLNAIHNKQESHLISVDIRDCSEVADSNLWTFVKMDSSKVNDIIKEAPVLNDGIDVIYIDSLHTPKHVYKEVYGWFPFLKKGGVIFFDDIDSNPYLKGQRKDNVGIEISNRKILELIESIFLSNINIVNLEIFKGSTGLARLEKICEKGINLQSPKIIKKRNNTFFWKLLNIFSKRKQYTHSTKTNESFLIDVTKY
ncbi:class I SAM-dependent methyltransferase [Prochlorococcus marinus]|uniref:class I SAM-dependent methyltransferase n=1 Tax=Prochlorococcus marinus TaxID=1219 RepID=UPI001ADC2B65|nr:class I SAM-dependent methyltransferase [Prochlorococcus marinus]MBO8217669.1 class I SAM-dependent methyltransferase [Prochlorococcus marinus XMU1405]MBW3040831.1 hypothetical protein [Prochlorococcus marinus str. MU1405]MBW3048290.1 hypothetical protein [Prochlorococcus marinus str. MU1406]